MINISLLQETVLSARNGGYSNIPAYDFKTDNIDECGFIMTHSIMREAVSYYEFQSATDEIIMEAALNPSADLTALVEGVVGAAIKKVVEFFKKIIEMIKGFITKLTAFFQKMMGKTSKWCTTMKPLLDKVWKAGNYQEFKYDMREYKEEYIISDLPTKAGEITKHWKGAIGVYDKSGDSIAKEIAADFNREITTPANVDITTANAMYPKGGENPNKSQYMTKNREKWEALAEDYKKDVEEFLEDWPGYLAGCLGVSGASSEDDVWTKVTENARPSNEKTSQTIGGKTQHMFEVVQKASKTIDSLKSTYKDHLADVTKTHDLLERRKIDFTKLNSDDANKQGNGEIVTYVNTAINALYDSYLKCTEKHENALNHLRQMNINLVQEMVNEYMSALTKFTSYKVKKDK